MATQRLKELLRSISKSVVRAQGPIRILDAIKWDPSLWIRFKKSRFKKMPPVDQAYYQGIPLGFDPQKKDRELKDILTRIKKAFDPQDSLGRILTKATDEYRRVVQMLQARGTKGFYRLATQLYGSPHDHFLDKTSTILSLSKLLSQILSNLNDAEVGPPLRRNKSPQQVVRILNQRFKKSRLSGEIRVELSDGILADAAAGSHYIKIHRGVQFSQKEIDMLEVHEGWVHVGTSVNGRKQRHAKWLAKGPPRCIATQEGLAVLMEILTLRSYPMRARKINDRIRGIHMAENGADFLEIFRFYREEGYAEPDAYRNAMRVCRGGLVEGGAPFTKDIAYCRGFIENYNFLRTAIRLGKPEVIRFLFVGKVHVLDVPMLYQKSLEGLVDPPKFLPPQFVDMSGLAVWMGFSNFLNQIHLKKVQIQYESLFRGI